jgi:hypothetical protein
MILETQTALYATILVLLGAASNHKEFIILALVFIVGVIAAQQWKLKSMYVNFIGIVACALVIAFVVGNKTKENFTTQLDVNPDAAPSKDCAVYYVPAKYQDACAAGYFDMSSVQLQLKKNDLLSKGVNANDQQIKMIDSVIEARSTVNFNDTEKRGCRLAIPNMYSQLVFDTTDQATIQARNGARNNGSGNWAFCWGKKATQADAINEAKNFGTKGVISAVQNTAVTFPGESSYWYQVNFNALDYASVNQALCTIPPTASLDSESIYLGFLVNENMNIVDKGVNGAYNLYTVKDNKLVPFTERYPYNTAMEVYRSLFGFTAVNNPDGKSKDIKFGPKNMNMSLCTFTFDMCGRVSKITKTTVGFSMDKLGVSTKTIGNIFNSTNIDLTTSIENLDKTYKQLLAERDSLANTLSLKDEFFKPGITMKKYPLSPSLQTHYWAGPKADTYEDMEYIYNTILKNTTPTETIVADIDFEHTYDELIAYEFIGFFDIPETGTYEFQIRSDDAGEIFIGEKDANASLSAKANRLVAHYYGYHGPWTDGTSMGKLQYNKGKVKFYARVFEWRGHEGLHLFWKKPGKTLFEQVPSSAYFVYDASSVSTKVAEIEAKLTDIEELRQGIASNTDDYVYELMLQCKNKNISSLAQASHVSADDRVYFEITPLPSTFSTLPPQQISSTSKQVIQNDMMDVVVQYRSITPPRGINFKADPEYTVSMWVYVHQPSSGWRTVIYYGEKDDWTNPSAANIDRTPGFWIYPSTDSKDYVQLQYVHRIKPTNDSGTTYNAGQNLTEASECPKYKTWFHYAVTVKKNVMKVYLNGVLRRTNDLGAAYSFDWNERPYKKFLIGGTRDATDRTKTTGRPVFIQRFYWYNTALSDADIKTLSTEAIVATPALVNGIPGMPEPTPANPAGSLRELFTNYQSASLERVMGGRLYEGFINATSSGMTSLKVGTIIYPIHIDIMSDGSKWLLILNYVHKGGTNPTLTVMNNIFPIPSNNTLGVDGSTDSKAWGHVGNKLLKEVYDKCGGFTKMRFFARNSLGSKIHFVTSDSKVINYAMTGKGNMQNMTYTLMSDHNASIPQNAGSVFSDQGDYALTNFPFWRSGQAHWGIRGLDNRWEVDNYQFDPDGYGTDTIHQVWIGV